MKLTNKLRSIILIVLSVIITIVVIKIMAGSKPEITNKDSIESIKGVRINNVELSDNRAIIPFSGKVNSFDKIEVFSEVSGVLQNANFKEGVKFSKGSPLIVIESGELRNNLKAQKSNLLTQVSALMGDIAIDFPNEQNSWEKFLASIEVDKSLPDLPEINDKKFKIYISGKQILNTYYSIKSQEERLSKYVINAPFNGIVSQTTVKQGTLIRIGQKIGEFVGTDVFDLETEFSLADKKYVHIGDKVTLSSEDVNKTWEGEVYRINPAVDPNSQMVKAYVKLTGEGLSEGMFMTGEIMGETYKNTTLISRKLVADNKVFVVDNGILKEKEIEVMYVNSDNAIVEGLQNGDKILRDYTKGMYAGMKVTILD